MAAWNDRSCDCHVGCVHDPMVFTTSNVCCTAFILLCGLHIVSCRASLAFYIVLNFLHLKDIFDFSSPFFVTRQYTLKHVSTLQNFIHTSTHTSIHAIISHYIMTYEAKRCYFSVVFLLFLQSINPSKTLFNFVTRLSNEQLLCFTVTKMALTVLWCSMYRT